MSTEGAGADSGPSAESSSSSSSSASFTASFDGPNSSLQTLLRRPGGFLQVTHGASASPAPLSGTAGKRGESGVRSTRSVVRGAASAAASAAWSRSASATSSCAACARHTFWWNGTRTRRSLEYTGQRLHSAPHTVTDAGQTGRWRHMSARRRRRGQPAARLEQETSAARHTSPWSACLHACRTAPHAC